MKKMTTIAFAMTLMASMPAMAEVGADPSLNLNPTTTPAVQSTVGVNADAKIGVPAEAPAAGVAEAAAPAAPQVDAKAGAAPEAEAKADSTNTKKLFHMFRDKPPVSEAKADVKAGAGIDAKADTPEKSPTAAPETSKPESQK
jgi:hypothetical protein